MSVPSSLSRRIRLGLLGYAVLLSAAVLLHGVYFNETAEKLVWHSLLNAELDLIIARRAQDPDFVWQDTETLELHQFDLTASSDDLLANLPVGLHDELPVNGRELVVMVRDEGPQRLVLGLDISDLESQERGMTWSLVLSALLLVGLMALLVDRGVWRLVRPLAEVARRIGQLDPQDTEQRIEPPAGVTLELKIIVDALNAYLVRCESFVQRERAFIDSSSHELRTPIAVMAGAAELGLAQPGVPASTTAQLKRIQHAARGVEQLISLLLVLAKSPERLASLRDRVPLHQLLPEIVEDHRYLCRDKDLVVALAELPDCEILAPLNIVQAAIGNLLRNAIENSDRGQIRIWLEPGCVVVIEDPGHGMTPEEISSLYRRMARGEARDRDGIGLALIARLCDHLGWSLDIRPRPLQGTVVRLDFSASRNPAGADD